MINDALLNYLIEKTDIENKISAGELMLKFRLSRRELRYCIEDLRLQGHPILCFADGKGYYYDEKRVNLDEFLDFYGHYAKQILRTSRAMAKGVNVNKKQKSR